MTYYTPPVDRLWWTRRRSYFVFVLREFTSVGVAWSALLLVYAAKGNEIPVWLVPINLIALAACVFHAITFLSLAPKATVVRLDGWRVPDYMIVGGNYGLWLFASLVLAWVVL
ncbi:hypothetical protein J5X84_17385 [Streptosporangiaceae bacterium NEAU-GS5]|nr:hypothetical protein [Streptosporangiaceae bacterium NEAU-GS5]